MVGEHERASRPGTSLGRSFGGPTPHLDQVAAMFDALFEASPAAVAAFSPDLTCLRANAAFAAACAQDLAGAESPTASDLLPDGEGLALLLADVATTGRPLIAHPLGATRPVGASRGSAPVRLLSAYRVDVGTAGSAGTAGQVVVVVIDNVADRNATDNRAQAANRRLSLLARASQKLGASLDVDATAEALVSLLVPALADHAMIDLVDLDPAGHAGGVLRRSAMAHTSDAPEPAVPYTERGRVVPYTSDNPAMRSLRSGRPVLIEHVNVDDLVAGANDAEVAKSLAAVGVRSQVAVPLAARDGVIGVLLLKQSTSGRDFTDDDVAVAAELAARAGVAIDNARRYEREHTIALTLQRSLLGERLTHTPELEATARYVPAEGGVAVSGDWYDLIPLGAGRIGLVIGDVMGRGLPAASIMGQVRAAARTLAHVDLPPRRFLSHLDGIVNELDEQLVTCSYAVYDPFTSALCTGSAGHLPPLVKAPGDETQELAVWQAVPLGVGGVPFGQSMASLPPGAVVALYSDGLVESPARDLERGIRQLRRAITVALNASDDLDAVADAVLDTMLPESQQYKDDVTLLLVRTPAHPGPRATLEVAAHATSVPNTRHFVEACLAGWGVDPDLTEVARLVASELVTNGLTHGSGRLVIRLRLGPQHVCLEVDDEGPSFPEPRTADDDDEGGRGLQLVEALADSWGTRPLDHGKSVWCMIGLTPA